MCASKAPGGFGQPRSRPAKEASVRHGAVASAEPAAADAEVKVGDATLTFKDSDPLQLPMFNAEGARTTAALAEEDRDQVDLELVAAPCAEGALRDARPVGQHVPVAGRVLGILTAVSRSFT